MENHAPTLTKVLATIGTASRSPEVLQRLIQEGAAAFRLNFSHGTLDDHAKTLAAIRDAERLSGRPIGVLGDLSGPKIRVGQVIEGGVNVEPGQDVVFQRESILATGPRFSTTCPQVIDDIRPGQKVLINDGVIRMLVVEGGRDSFTCRVTVGGLVTSGKGINLPATALQVDAITERDWQCLEWAVENELDFVAMSFVRRGRDITRLRQRMIELCRKRNRRPIPVVAKIEKPEAVANIQEILEEADIIMVARGDLGVEMDLAEIPALQNRLVNAAHHRGRPVIVATQMLETMITNPSPTRAEVSDVGNAIFDLVDTVMLSGETAVGKYPILAVGVMHRIAQTSEAYLHSLPPEQRPPSNRRRSPDHAHWVAALAHGALTISNDVHARIIVGWSQTGTTALQLSRHDFGVPIYIFSDDRCTLRRISLLRGVIPVEMPRPADLDDFTTRADRYLLERGIVEAKAPILLLAGHPIERDGATNSLAVHYVGDPTTGYRNR